MSNALRKVKRGKQGPSPLDPSWLRGFNAGVKQQRESDIKFLMQLLENLEELPGIGEKTADKIRKMVLSKFGK